MLLLVGLISIALGVIIFILSLKSYRDGRECLQWPVAEGEIIASEILERWYRPPRPSSRRKEWLPYIVYEYSIDGIKYVSTQIKRASQSWGSRKHAEKLTHKYTERRIVSVYYHPTIREAVKLNDASEPFSKFIAKFVTLPDGLEIYKSATSPSPVLIKDTYTQDAKVGNAILEPGVEMGTVFITLLIGVVFMITGVFFLYGSQMLFI